MIFRTSIPTTKASFSISYTSALMFIGACFSLHIHRIMHGYKFDSRSNPFGTVYNPKSLYRQLMRIARYDPHKPYTKTDLHFHNERWFSFDHHSEFSSSQSEQCLADINQSLETAHQHLIQCKVLFLTLGTAWAYTHKQLGITVSNCHKLPSKNFSKALIPTHEIIEDIKEAIQTIREVNPNLHIVFSISPIRHVSDGYFENQVSKGRLFNAIHEIRIMDKSIEYFPSYEYLMDDLRDYRFYASDMIHPSDLAIDYIWDKFTDTYMDKTAQSVALKIKKILQSIAHRPFAPKGEAHQKFIDKTIQEIKYLSDQYDISFEQELEILRQRQI